MLRYFLKKGRYYLYYGYCSYSDRQNRTLDGRYPIKFTLNKNNAMRASRESSLMDAKTLCENRGWKEVEIVYEEE